VDEYYRSGDKTDWSKVIFTINDQNFFEMTKIKIRKETIAYSIKRKREHNDLEKQLEGKIWKLETIYNRLTPDEKINLENNKDELEQLRTEKIRGIIFRSKVQWYEEGEKSNQYLFSLERKKNLKK
jgi:hypothetical protein